MPQEPGVYIFLDKESKVLYVGKARNLKNRVSSYFSNNLLPRTKLLVSKIEKIRITPVGSEIESLLLEANYIKKYRPIYNVKLADGKSYPMIKITVDDRYPKVLVVRHMNDNPADAGSLYFGPYPNPSSMRLVLKTLRKIFPFQSVLNHSKKSCLYFHIGLCPCPPVFDSRELKAMYRMNIKHIIQILEGHAKSVMRDLIKERNNASKLEQFEKAAKIQYQIDALKLIVTPVYKPFEYEVNPNLRKDVTGFEVNEFKESLRNAGVKISSLKRIECFDISNISGKMSTGSMVVFIDGEKDTSSYRRFKINPKIIGPNDFAMMGEVLRRRIKHLQDWGIPDLIIVDGGKGQISSVINVLKENNFKVPVIGLAKREEKIITADYKIINLSKDSSALHLIMRIRDEAHRFAITYHRKLRSNFLKD